MLLFLKGFLKDRAYSNNLHMAKKLELKISEAVIGTSNETLAAVV
jgi:hypothetical protein